MEILEKYQKYLESKNINYNELEKDAQNISLKYRTNKNNGSRMLSKENEAVAYALSRMPATYQVVKFVIQKAFENNDFEINSLLDIGAGTGAGTIAIEEEVNLKEINCYEKEEAMRKVGKEVMSLGDELLQNANWKTFDLVFDSIDINSDLVIASYVINELAESDRDEAVKKMYNATNKLLIIIEPGTPEGFKHINKARNLLISEGTDIVAPCTHLNKCELSNDDWCNCSTRLNRTKIHKNLKNGSSPFEDEKFSYIIFSKQKCVKSEKRILRHPIINSGYSEFKVCTPTGIENIKLSKKHGELYKKAKKLKNGDSL